ncbi:hypothetical protein HK405_011103 [Cladochytrium tenue]|nr:hypothetical protein HK405_011103 [Cladochytrium tenue]
MKERTKRANEDLHEAKMMPPPLIDRSDPNIPSTVFRLFLTHIGYLNVDCRERLKPLPLTEDLLKDLERRECISISVLSETSFNQAANGPFGGFLTSLGWRVKLATHKGYTGGLSPQIADSTVYFASRTAEVIFQSPGDLRPVPTEETAEPDVNGSRPTGKAGALREVYTTVTAENTVAVLWAPSAVGVSDLGWWRRHLRETLPWGSGASLQPQTAATTGPAGPAQGATSAAVPYDGPAVCIVVTPAAGGAAGLNAVRVFARQALLIGGAGTAPDDAAAWVPVRSTGPASGGGGSGVPFGPLVDEMIVSRRTLGVLTRLTAINAHLYCRTIKGGYRKP